MIHIPYRPQNPAQPSRWFPVKNTSGSDAPANAVLKITGVDANGVVTVIQPDADNIDPAMLCIADAAGVKASQYGQATNQGPWYAATPDSPAVGDNLGTAASTWTLAAGKSGFMAWTAAVSGIFLAMPAGGGGGVYQPVRFNFVAMGGVPYVTDTNPAHAGSPSPFCFYDVSLWTGWDPITGDTVGESLWAVLTYNPTVYPFIGGVGWSPPSAIYLDGNSVHDAWDSGKRYDPIGGDDRRVFRCNQFGWAWRVDCAVTGPATDNEG